MRRNIKRYRTTWESANTFPSPCHFCGGDVTQWGRHANDAQVHHLDDDFTNDALENLTVAHVRCHIGHHNHLRLGTPKSAHHRAAMSRAARRRSVSHRDKLIAAHLGKPKLKLRDRPKSAEHRVALSAALRRRVQCSVCEYENTVAQVGRHRKAVGH